MYTQSGASFWCSAHDHYGSSMLLTFDSDDDVHDNSLYRLRPVTAWISCSVCSRTHKIQYQWTSRVLCMLPVRLQLKLVCDSRCAEPLILKAGKFRPDKERPAAYRPCKKLSTAMLSALQTREDWRYDEWRPYFLFFLFFFSFPHAWSRYILIYLFSCHFLFHFYLLLALFSRNWCEN